MNSYSGKQISKAGRMLLDAPNLTDSDLDHAIEVMGFWRSCHDKPLERAFDLLRETVSIIDKQAIFAKRLKRLSSIFRKLRRFESMDLRNMQDIGGCRAIVATEKKLRQSVRLLKRAREFRSTDGTVRAKDYVQNPKPDGYRSYHLVGKFEGDDGIPRNIEFQIRTRLQHYWATALEIVELFTGQALKSNRGSPEWKSFFEELGTQFAVIDGIHMFDSSDERSRTRRFLENLKKNHEYRESHSRFKSLCKKLRIVETMAGYANSIEIVNNQLSETRGRGYVLITINTDEKIVDTKFFGADDSIKANEYYVMEEKRTAKQDAIVVALVSSTAVGGIKEAYPNYFADSTEFMKRVIFLQAIV